MPWVEAFVYQFNVVVDTSYPTAHVTAQGYAVTVGTYGELRVEVPTAHATIQGYFDYVDDGMPVNINVPTAESDVCGYPVIVITSKEHGCYLATYSGNNRKPNMVLVIGRETATGNLVFGYADDSAGENMCAKEPRLLWYRSTSVSTFNAANYVANILLDKFRLSVNRGQIIISPNIGQEIWDVIETADTVLNVNTTFRVRGWTLHYDRDEGEYYQTLKLTNV